jgi:hypothetical protein
MKKRFFNHKKTAQISTEVKVYSINLSKYTLKS